MEKESWAPNNWCFWTVILEKTLESPLDCKEIQPVHPKGDQSWVFIGRTDAEAETPILWQPDAKNWFIWRDPDAGKDWGWEEKRTTEEKMVGWHHQLNGHGFGWTPEVGDGQGSLAHCGSWGREESDMTERLNWTEYASLKLLTRLICQDSGEFDRNSESALAFLVFRKNEKKLLITLYSNFSCTGCNRQVTRCQYNQLSAMAIRILQDLECWDTYLSCWWQNKLLSPRPWYLGPVGTNSL